MSASTLEDLLKRWLTPPGFFLGMALGFAACCVAGRKAPALLPICDFQRFHRFLNPEGLYFPTALQVRALARRELPRDKIAVVVGGSSVMQGRGQKADELWTKRLQTELGDDFRVLNLAMPGGAPNEHGQLAAEMLCRDGRKVIYVCDCFVNGFADAPDGNRDVYRYFFHDARARNLLLPHAERDRALADLAGHRGRHDAFAELTIQTGANRWLSFNDLWHAVGYEHVFATWLKHARKTPWQARKRLADPPPDFKSFQRQRPEGLNVARDMCRPDSPEEYKRLARQVNSSVPAPLRSRTLAVVNRFNPEYLQTIESESAGACAHYEQRLRNLVNHLQATGLHAVAGCVTLSADDYIDLDHLFASGGDKLALELAPAIRQLAQNLKCVPQR